MGRLRPLNKAINQLLVHRQKVAQIGQNLGPGMVYKQGDAGNDAVFDQELTHSLNGVSGAPRFASRASAATHTDHEGIVKTTLTSEMRFPGARRVENIIPTPDHNAWAIIALTSKAAIAFNHVSITSTTGALLWYHDQVANPLGSAGVGRQGRVSFEIRRTSGSFTSVNVYAGLNSSINIPITDDWQRVCGPVFTDSNALIYYGTAESRGLNVTGDTVEIRRVQVEEVTGQSVQTPSEYVSVGMGDSHGSNVDGVKYFNSLNANAVNDGKFVQEIAGAALSYNQLHGLRIDPTITNLQTNSEAGQTNFIPLGGTLDTGVKATPLGPRANCSTTIDGGSSIHGVFCVNHLGGFTTVTANVETATSVYIKSPQRYIGVANGVNMPGQKGTFDTVNKTWHNLGTDVTGATAWEVAEGFWRLSIVWINAATTLVGIYAATGDSNDVFVSNTIAGSPVVTAVGAQIEQLSVLDVKTSYIPSDGTSATSRLIDQVRYDPSPEMQEGNPEAYAIFFDMWSDDDYTDASSNGILYCLATGTNINGRHDLYLQTNNQKMRAQISHDGVGVNVDAASSQGALGQHTRYGFRFDFNQVSTQSRLQWFVDGDGPELGGKAIGRLPDFSALTNYYIGTSGINSSPLRSSIKNIKIYRAALSDLQMKAFTRQP